MFTDKRRMTLHAWRDLEVKEMEKLKQLELLTHLKTTIVFPADPHGVQWKRVDPLRVWSHREMKMSYQKPTLSVREDELPQLVLESEYQAK